MNSSQQLQLPPPDNSVGLTAASLFAGIGGFCLGLRESGIETAWAVENDPASVRTYTENVGARIICNEQEIPKSIVDVSVHRDELPVVDILHAGFPCQSFSVAGSRKGFDDPRGRLFHEIIRLVREYDDNRPSVLLLENSPNLRNGDSGRWFMEVMSSLRDSGYWFRDSNAYELNSYDFTHVPQQRSRLFMVAFATNRFKNGRLQMNLPRTDWKTPLDQIINFDGQIDDDSYYLDSSNKYYSMMIDSARKPNSVVQLRKHVVREKGTKSVPTLTANMGQGGHNVPFVHDKKGLRKLTEFECLKLQGFPDAFTFPKDVPRAKRYQQIGNSVVPPLISLLGKVIHEKILQERL